MRRVIVLFVLAAFCTSPAKSERVLETALDPAKAWQQNTSYEGKILIAAYSDSYLLSYDDETFTRFTYPTVAGVQMTFTWSRNPLVNFEGTVFFGLEPLREIPYHPLGIQYLYKFNGHHFARITIPGNLRSNCVVYGGYLFFLSKVSTTTRLYRYSAGIVTEVVGANILNDDGYHLRVIEGNLYITGHPGYEGYYSFIRRYDGSNFLTIFEDHFGRETSDIFPIPGTNRLYFTTENKIVYYHNGITARSVFSGVSDGSLNARIWRNELYFTQPTHLRDDIIVPANVYKVSGATVTGVTLPPGYQFTHSPDIEVYNSSLFLDANFSDGSSRLLRYDGISFNFLINFPSSGTLRSISMRLRENDLIIQGGNPTHTHIYNGSVFEEIILPSGYHLSYTGSPFVSSTNCNYLWQLYTNNPAHGYYDFIYAKESKNCPPPPPPPPPHGPVAVIPDHFMIHERFEAAAIGTDRGWCWNEIIFGWDTIPICPVPPCPEPNYQLRMIDVNNKIAWSESFSKPSKFAVPLKDDQSFETILSSVDNKTDLLIFDPDLVPKGVEEIKLLMVPKKGLFVISVSTRKKESVPLRVALLNEEGKEIWMQTFTAPFTMQITATVQKAGKTLVFSIPDEGSKFITRAKDP